MKQTCDNAKRNIFVSRRQDNRQEKGERQKKRLGTHIALELALLQGVHVELIVGVGLVTFVEGLVTAGAVPTIVGSPAKSATVRPLRVHQPNCCLKKFE